MPPSLHPSPSFSDTQPGLFGFVVDVDVVFLVPTAPDLFFLEVKHLFASLPHLLVFV